MAIFDQVLYLKSGSGTIVFVVILIFLVVFEGLLHILEEQSKKYGFKGLVEKLNREFMILGFISFGSYVAFEAYHFEHNEWFTAFHFAHLVVLFIALTFVLQAGLLMGLVYARKLILLKYSQETSQKLLHDYDEMMGSPSSFSSFMFHNGPQFISWPNLREKVELKIIEEFFIRSYHLPIEFNFADYMCSVLKKYVVSLVDVRPIHWLLLGCLAALNYGRIKAIDSVFHPCKGNPNESHHYDDDHHHQQITHDTNKCRSYLLKYAFICICFLMLYLLILLFASDIYLERLIGKVLDREEAIENEMKERRESIEGDEMEEVRAEKEEGEEKERNNSDNNNDNDSLVLTLPSKYQSKASSNDIELTQDIPSSSASSTSPTIRLPSPPPLPSSSLPPPPSTSTSSSLSAKFKFNLLGSMKSQPPPSSSSSSSLGSSKSTEYSHRHTLVHTPSRLMKRRVPLVKDSSWTRIFKVVGGRRDIYYNCLERIYHFECQIAEEDFRATEDVGSSNLHHLNTNKHHENVNISSPTSTLLLRRSIRTSLSSFRQLAGFHQTTRKSLSQQLQSQSQSQPQSPVNRFRSRKLSFLFTPADDDEYNAYAQTSLPVSMDEDYDQSDSNKKSSQAIYQNFKAVLNFILRMIMNFLNFFYIAIMARKDDESETHGPADNIDNDMEQRDDENILVKKMQNDLESMFLFSNAGLYYHAVEFSLLLQCLYVALWFTNFIVVALDTKYSVLWEIALSLPMVFNFIMLRKILQISCTLKSISHLDVAVLNKICERALDERNITAKLRRILRDKLKEVKDLKRDEWQSFLSHQFSHYLHDNKDGLTYNEFIVFLSHFQIRLTSSSVRRIFNMIDFDRDGILAWQELSSIVFPEHRNNYKKRRNSVNSNNSNNNNNNNSNSNQYDYHSNPNNVLQQFEDIEDETEEGKEKDTKREEKHHFFADSRNNSMSMISRSDSSSESDDEDEDEEFVETEKKSSPFVNSREKKSKRKSIQSLDI